MAAALAITALEERLPMLFPVSLVAAAFRNCLHDCSLACRYSTPPGVSRRGGVPHWRRISRPNRKFACQESLFSRPATRHKVLNNNGYFCRSAVAGPVAHLRFRILEGVTLGSRLRGLASLKEPRPARARH